MSKGVVCALKAVKNEVELAGFHSSHLRDGVALVRYFAWLQASLLRGETVTESGGADHLLRLRQELPLFKGLSFETISSTGPNGAIIHYQPHPDTCPPIELDAIYLCDSGAQFLDGTTDTTRTHWFGEQSPSNEITRAYTRVLQGNSA